MILEILQIPVSNQSAMAGGRPHGSQKGNLRRPRLLPESGRAYI